MRFFSNDAKDNVDDQDAADQAAKAEVPQQRAGSPWQHGPSEGADRPVTHEPAPQPTAFGASTVGGAVAASAAAGPYDTDGHSTDRVTDASSGIADDRTVVLDSRPGDRADGVIDDRIDDRVDRRVDERLDDRVDDRVDDRLDSQIDDRLGHRVDDRVDDRLDDRVDDRVDDRLDDADRTVTIDQDRTVPIGERAGDVTPDRHPHDDEVVDIPLEDKGTFDDPKVTDETETDHSAEKTSVEEIVAVPATTTESTISGPAPFFPTAETQALKERWRDVQLRFVDDPKGATGEAAQLVDEAVDKLTTALRDQRGSLAKGTEDTEALRVELRAYRDILDRLLGL